ncbi:zf-DNL-domain-containing protein [Zopfia rhizophila CBS 207.26]|uniref:Zf-DNL-domain-containing protein n=1 Tax=Zopfia rhizophila CBS 207.26 TaxID=1314779 RepID=A0A6A6EYE0_9PEZI|nr:zf-DNL-domain-containing protein [Zopfia rhizophila CBS 207.26]
MRHTSTFLWCLSRSLPLQATRAYPAEFIPVSKRLYHTPRTSILPRPQLFLQRRHPIASIIRHESTSSPSSQSGSTAAPESRLNRDEVPAYEMTFTCKKCSTRSSHRVSKQGYHHGTVLITCPGCKNRHLISDHLKIFSDKRVTIEDLMREKGQLVKRGSLSTEGDVELWDDGSTTPRSSNFIPSTTTKNDSNAEEGRLTEPPTLQEASWDDADPGIRKS